MPNSCSINRARRGAVHNSVAKPCSVGLSASQRATIFSWVGVNFGGRPGTGCAAKPAAPCWRKAASQRRTVRRSTPRKSATSPIEYPSSTRCTAKHRRYSKTAGEPSVLMADAIANRRPSGHYFPRSLYPTLAMRDWWPRSLKRFFYWTIDALVVDRHLTTGLNAVRAELGLPPVRRAMHTWWNSPQLVLGLFPAWFGPPQPDWPPQTRLTGFPLYDERDATPPDPELTAFLDAGAPPIVFTPGSAMQHGRPFFEAAADACRRLGRRGLLLSRFPEQLPADVPEGVRHLAYAPFSRLLPRAAALVHHGGIGTSAQGMAAGLPQLGMPLAHDQFDNAARLRRLGVARSLAVGRFRGPAVAAALRSLLDSPEVSARCREVAGRFRDARPLDEACDAVGSLAAP